MYRSALVAAAAILIAGALAAAGKGADVVFPEGWFSLAAEEAGIVFMLRNHGPDISFDVVDETGDRRRRRADRPDRPAAHPSPQPGGFRTGGGGAVPGQFAASVPPSPCCRHRQQARV
jgi:hypothetical protein